MKLAAFSLLLLASSLMAAPPEIVLCHYNVENYADAKPPGPDSPYGTKAKPEKSIAAMVGILKEINPDVLGVCEMGSRERFADFQKRLNDAGLGYIDSEFVEAADVNRHLALVSRFPIVARNSATDVPFELNGQPQKVRRGFLDVTVAVNAGYRLRLVGVHLKSKLPVPEGEALIRRHEVLALRSHVEKILVADPAANLLCYGDFNDTKNEPTFAEIAGVHGTPTFLDDLPAKDPLGDRWTHYWKTADSYTRIDYIFASRAVLPEVVKNKLHIYRGDDWNQASDHRPVFISLVPQDRK